MAIFFIVIVVLLLFCYIFHFSTVIIKFLETTMGDTSESEIELSEDDLNDEVDFTSKYPKTAVSNHLIPFGFSEEDCDVLLKAKDHSMVAPAYFLESISECFERKFVQHGGMVKVKGDTNNKIRHSIEMTHLHLENVIQALSFYFPPQMISLSGKFPTLT